MPVTLWPTPSLLGRDQAKEPLRFCTTRRSAKIAAPGGRPLHYRGLGFRGLGFRVWTLGV